MEFNIFKNPELQRNAWLELRPARLIVLTCLIAWVYALLFTSFGRHADSWNNIREASIWLFHILITVWGTKITADSVADEINQKTWDRQRMTGLSPWKLAVGKLFGPTLFQWYGAALCMATYFFFSVSGDDPMSHLIKGITVIATGLLANSLALLLSLLSITGAQTSSFSHARINTTFIFILSLLVSFSLLLGGQNFITYLYNPTWYGLLSGEFLQLFVVLVCAAWAIVGVYRNMRTEMQYSNDSRVWVLFLIFIILFCYGFNGHRTAQLFTQNEEPYPVSAMGSFLEKITYIIFLLTGITSVLLVIERKGLADYKIFNNDLNTLNFRNLDYSAPLWLVSALFSLAMALVAVTTSFFYNPLDDFNGITRPAGIISSLFLFHYGQEAGHNYLPIFYVGTILLLARDIFVTRYLFYCTNFKNKMMSVLTYYFIVYMAFPRLFGMNGNPGLGLFLPFNVGGYQIMSILSFVAQVTIAYLFYRTSFRSKYR